MSSDPFGLPTKKKMMAYACIAGGILSVGCAFFVHQGVSLWRMLLFSGVIVAICGGVMAGTIWLSGGRRSEVPVGPAGVKPPVRLMKALPYAFVLIALFYLLKLVGMFLSK